MIAALLLLVLLVLLFGGLGIFVAKVFLAVMLAVLIAGLIGGGMMFGRRHR